MATSDRMLAEVEQRLAAHHEELVGRLREALEATLFSNRSFIRPSHLNRIAAEEAGAFFAFLKDEDVAVIRAQGAKRAEEGLGEPGALRLGATLRRFCLAHLEGGLLQVGLEATDAYTGAFMEGFMEAREAIVLDEQERIRAALQRALSRYTLQLQTAAEIAQAATSILDLSELLSTSVELIRARFDLYYVGIFLVDEYGEWAILRAGTGEAGQEMLRRGHKLKVGGKSMIGWCTAHSQARIALDVGKEAVRFDNPLLPETRSEMALPLISRGRVIGGMTIQSTRVAAFSDEDIITLQTMADQLANAIENARLFAEVQARAAEIEATHRRYLREEWAKFLAEEEARRLAGYAYEQSTATAFPVGDLWRPEIEQAVRRGEVIALTESAGASSSVGATAVEASAPLPQPRSALAAPLTLRGEVIGALDLYEAEQERQWSEDDIALVEAVSAQVARAIENARLIEEIQRTAEHLKELDRLKSQFLANMSHELRTPLNSIIGFSRVILKGIDGPLTETQRTDLQAIYESGQHLLGLINDILDLSKIEAGKMELTFERVDLHEIIKGVMSTAIALVKDKPIELQQSIAPGLPMIYGDARRIRQVFLNLISNAAKFTEEGFIRLTAEATPTEVVISVADSGIGIPPEKVKRIFEPFTQVDASTTRRAGGTGLGLSISKHFVEMHGGRIWVESTPGEGSTFYFTLPIEPVSPPIVEKRPVGEWEQLEPEPGRKLVLCIDDDEGVITLLRRYLSKQGYQVVGLTDSTIAVERARQLKPFAITLDVLMPNKDGWQVIQELKADPETSRIPVVMCTIVSEKERGLSLGASEYLIKPILEQDLLATLDRLDRQAGRHRVLVVDDQPEDRSLLRRVIESQEEYEVIEAAGGQEAIALIKQVQPHIIILDLMMPEVDGFAVLEAVKGDEATRSIPIIVVTAKDLSQEERDRLNSRVEALLQKGLFEQQELLADVAAALEQLAVGD